MTTQRIALITGGGRGIGRSAALALAADGVDTILTYVSDADAATATADEITALGRTAVVLPLDAGDSASFPAFAETVGAALQGTWQRDTFDVLVNNGGNQAAGLLGDVTEADFDALVDVHFKGVLFLTQALLPLIADDGGTIVNISSGLTRFTFPQRIAYASMKGAVEVMTRYFAEELGPRGITANTIAPGAVATDFSGGMLRDTPAMQEHIAEVTALRRYAVADDIGPAIAAIASPANRWVTGQRIEVSGGMRL
jgi:NAD(P)-dependent dehydrogenase (short-subunit alcohol dehydrogenase family)